MALPQYIKDAQNNYNAKFDIIQLKLPQGTKNRIKAIIGEDGSMAAYCKQAVLTALESDGDLQKETSPETQEVSKSVPVEEVPQEQTKEPETAYREPTLEDLQELQELINQKKAEQDRKAEEQQKRKEEQEQQEKEERKAELLEHMERIKNGEQIPEDEEKEKLRQESIIKSQHLYY